MWVQRTYNSEKESNLLEAGTPKMLARLLAQRDVAEENVESFIASEYQDLSHPHELHDVEKAARIFCDNALDKGKVAIIGDYDCDGIVSSTMLKELCNIFELKCDVFLPSRLECILFGWG